MTAVETIIRCLEQNQYFIGNDLYEVLNQAKEMEKQKAQEYAEFAIICNRQNMPILEFDAYVKLKTK